MILLLLALGCKTVPEPTGELVFVRRHAHRPVQHAARANIERAVAAGGGSATLLRLQSPR